ncbi:MAG TPA: D-glucuronyl C5-epimerase family protein [Solirubrobacteraceae bacterium]|nr:D-glucuronyl C5-epimerase family protein [Solirubrobacteraceae bacterium]
MPAKPSRACPPPGGAHPKGHRLALGIAVAALWALACPPTWEAPDASAAHRVTVTAALQRLQRSGAITETAYRQYQGAYSAARTSLRKLSGTRRVELGAVVANVEAMAARGQLVASRLPLVFTTLERNRQWWTTEVLLGGAQRVSFQGSRLVWEYYPGQGIEIQWLGTFGEANGYYLSHQTTALKEVLGEAIALATQRAGGIAWEYLFQFDGGAPPWTSGLSQGTAIQALARAWSMTHEQQFLTAAQQALGLFRTRPSAGVRVATPAGAHYLEYTYAPSERILNGFVQSLVGLYEYAKLTGDPQGQQLFEAGDAEARAEAPSYDTGAWSKYDQSSESNLSYHELLAEFLEHLCQKTSKGEPLAPTIGQIPGDEIYCTTAQRFREDQKTPPAIALLTQTVRTRERAGVQLKLSKVANVSMTIKLGEKTVWTNTVTVEGGRPRLLWVTPSKAGVYSVELRATDLAGNEEVASGAITAKRAPKARHATARTTRSLQISPPARRLPVV